MTWGWCDGCGVGGARRTRIHDCERSANVCPRHGPARARDVAKLIVSDNYMIRMHLTICIHLRRYADFPELIRCDHPGPCAGDGVCGIFTLIPPVTNHQPPLRQHLLRPIATYLFHFDVLLYSIPMCSLTHCRSSLGAHVMLIVVVRQARREPERGTRPPPLFSRSEGAI